MLSHKNRSGFHSKRPWLSCQICIMVGRTISVDYKLKTNILCSYPALSRGWCSL